MKLQRQPYDLCILGSMIIGLSLGGCGITAADPAGAAKPLPTECDNPAGQKPEQGGLVVLDWTGGTSPIYPNEQFKGVDLGGFLAADGGTLVDDEGLFQELVRQEVSRIYCDSPEVSLRVLNGEDEVEGIRADTVVLLTQEVRPDGSLDIGQAEYDPCNRQNDNTAIIFGKRIQQLGGAYTREEWVRVFANVIAHEIGHTLGYAHVTRNQTSNTERSLYVELMLDRHTMTEMRQEQRFLGDQTNCPDHLPDNQDSLQGNTIIRRPTHQQ